MIVVRAFGKCSVCVCGGGKEASLWANSRRACQTTRLCVCICVYVYMSKFIHKECDPQGRESKEEKSTCRFIICLPPHSYSAGLQKPQKKCTHTNISTSLSSSVGLECVSVFGRHRSKLLRVVERCALFSPVIRASTQCAAHTQMRETREEVGTGKRERWGRCVFVRGGAKQARGPRDGIVLLFQY